MNRIQGTHNYKNEMLINANNLLPTREERLVATLGSLFPTRYHHKIHSTELLEKDSIVGFWTNQKPLRLLTSAGALLYQFIIKGEFG